MSVLNRLVIQILRVVGLGKKEPALGQQPRVLYSEGDEQNCMDAGAAAVIRKPNIKTLRRRVGQLLSKRGEA